ncbi:ATP-binding protein [Herbiconiux sp. P13]
MLGEQLIKNERVALVELVKNAYDADATRVLVDFRGFADNFTPGPGATIAITDDGIGMTDELVRTAWMNPATPSKKLAKGNEPKTTLGRVLQGEKGIGRFATFKLGSEVTLVTRAIGHDRETTLVVDISLLDEEPGAQESIAMDLYLEDVPALHDISSPTVFNGSGIAASTHGTQLAISHIRANWNRRLVQGAFDDLNRLQPLMWGEPAGGATQGAFEVVFLRDGVDLQLGRQRSEDFERALEHAVLKVRDGRFDAEKRTFDLRLNERSVVLSVDDGEVRGLKPFKDRFLKDEAKDLPLDTRPEFSCGSFNFEFYVFDLDRVAPDANRLDSEQSDLIKDHRIYLYRDGIRVYPYGDPDDDWLEIDATRGTEGAGRALSNDQTVGYVAITQAENPQLRDKTSREGLIEAGAAIADFKALVSTILRYLRQQYQPHLDAKSRAKRFDLKQHRIDRHIQALRNEADLPKKAVRHLDDLEKALSAERDLSSMQLARTEQLAGVGLSVETASHDLILAGSEALRSARQIVAELKLLDLIREPVYAMATQLVTRLEFVSSRFRDVQGLFVSTRQKQSEQDVVQALKRVKSIYDRLHRSKNIEFDIDPVANLRAVATEAAILQLLINLVDNATYWLISKLMPAGESRIIRAFTPDESTLVITDNGPGVKDQDAPFLFEPFYSGKGEEGKGLGLYIARQNGLRGGFSIALERTGDLRELPGATFVVRFGEMKESRVDS